MKSIREIYKIGRGPSSSHTMGPEKACMIFKGENPEADSFKVILYDSLASTDEGHGTDRIIKETLAPIEVEIVLDLETQDLPHENTMDLFAYRSGEQIGKMRVMSVGGGDIEVEGRSDIALAEIYEEDSLTAIIDYCRHKNIRLSKFVFEKEGEGIKEFLYKVWQCMDNEIEEGLMADGILPGGLNVMRVANLLYNKRHIDERPETKENRIVCAYAFAAAEQNAGGGTIVTAPTCGACAVLPAVLKYMKEKKNFSDDDVIRALAVAGLIGTLVKHNASISGAECGCQAEIGTASAMAAAALCEIFEMGYGQIEYAAEMCIEHHLGLTCDPLCGLVQIPCIERNAVAAMRAMSALSLANFLVGTRKISFDMVVKTMYETGKDLHSKYRETSTGGLAKLYDRKRTKKN